MKVENINISHVRAFSDPKPIEEDPESSQAVFEDKDIAPYIQDFNPYNIENDHDLAQEVIQIYQHLFSANVYTPPIHRAYKSLSLAEALVIIELIHGHNKEIDVAKLKLDSKSKFTSKSIIAYLKFYTKKNKIIKTYKLVYDSSRYVVTIYESSKKRGAVRYILRGRKCEEIQGHFDGKKLILDPVWHPVKKGVLKHIHLEFSKIKTTLIFHSNSKESIGKSSKLNVTNKAIKKTTSKALVKKELAVDKFKITTQLMFDKKILLPIMGAWKISLNKNVY